jgi:hypothetical protein
MANIINQYGQVKLGVRYASAPSITLTPLLDTYGGAAAAYSLRKLRTAYTGAAIRVRRSSDDTTLDVGFKSDGTLDTTSMLSFVGNGNGFVSIWYDQSGNGLHFTQPTSISQPSIVINSAITSAFGEPAVRFNSVNKNYLEIPSSTSSFNFLHNGTDSTVISVARYFFTTNPISDSTLISNGGGGSATVGTWVGFSDTSPYNNAFGAYITRGVGGIGDGATHTAQSMVSDTALPFSKQNFHFVNINASAAAIDRIKVQYDDYAIAKNNIRSNTPSTANSTNNMMMGVYVQGGVKYHALEGDVQELIIYNSNQDTSRNGIKSNINSFYSIYTTDADAQAFITAAAITGATQVTAINTLVNDLKTANIWTKMKAIYPFVGGTAAQHRFNLKDPRAVDAAYYLTFYGGGTHSSTGYLPNGNSYADTKLMPSVLSTNSQHLSYYSRTQIISGQIEIGANSSANNNFLGIYYSPTSGLRTALASGTRTNIAIPSTNTQGFFMSNRPSSTYINIWKNNSKLTTDNITSTGNDNAVMYIGAVNGTTLQYSTKESAFASIGDGLTDTEATAFYTAVQKYQTTLGRAV